MFQARKINTEVRSQPTIVPIVVKINSAIESFFCFFTSFALIISSTDIFFFPFFFKEIFSWLHLYYIILFYICQEVFEKFFDFFDVAGAVWRRDHLTAHKFLFHSHYRLSVPPLTSLVSVRGYDRSFLLACPFDIIIIAYISLSVNPFLKIF